MRRALVTGAGGFVGAHLLAGLVEGGWTVTATVRPGSDPHRLRRLDLLSRVAVESVDLTDPEALGDAVRAAAPDVAFCLAAARAGATALEREGTIAVNTLAAARVVEALPAQCTRLIALGSSTEYAASGSPMDESTPLRPRSFFGATKAAGSLLLHAAAARRDLPAVVLRAFQVYGPLDHPGRLVPTVLRAAQDGSVVPLTAAGRRRDWVWVGDVVTACLLAAEREVSPGQVLNIGTGTQTTNEDLVTLAREVTGRPIPTAPQAHPGRDWDTPSWVCDPAAARKVLGWVPTMDLRAGLAACWSAG
ncbi:MAG TPA: NAD(P)-dependent oxidoreductase [Mycobacteriales bacterium]|nr:NAD(P)-dependent oxidoreductase [Mycobacteriales bacterium]